MLNFVVIYASVTSMELILALTSHDDVHQMVIQTRFCFKENMYVFPINCFFSQKPCCTRPTVDETQMLIWNSSFMVRFIAVQLAVQKCTNTL